MMIHQNIQMRKHAHIEMKRLQAIIKRQSHWKIFPIEIANGAIPLTETGYKPIKSKITDFGQYELILTGDTPVVLNWKNSTLIYQKNKGITDPDTHITTGQDEFYTKQYKVGDYWNAYLIEDSSGIDFGNLPNQTIFKTISTKRQYTLVMFEEQIITDDYLQFFIVFNDKNENIGGQGKNQDRQILYLSNAINYYSPYNGDFSMQVLTFSSVNDKLTASGQTTQGFLNWSSPGSGYAFPTIIDGIVTLNKTLMRDIGVRYAHRQSYGLELLSSCYYYGRPIIQGQEPIKQGIDEIYEQKVFASRRLFIAGNNEFSTTPVTTNGGLFAGINDPITTNSHPETTFYNIMDAKPTGYTNYDSWQKFLEARQFDLFAQKDFKGMLTLDITKAKNSNGTSISEAKMFWDSEWNITNLTGEYNVDMSNNFKYKDPDTGKIIPHGSTIIDYSKIIQKYMSTILNFNALVFSPLIQMPYDSQQWLPFALSNIPLIGKLWNILTLGIPTGFIINQSLDSYQKMKFFNGFMSAFFTSNLSSIIGNSDKDLFIPLNVFDNTSDFAIGKMLGSNVSTTAMLMKLTDRISVYPWDPKTGIKLTTREQISTVDLSQKKNDKVYIMSEDTEFLDIASPLTNEDKDLQWNPTANGIADGKEYAYIIDTITSQSLHQGEERHTFYSDNPYIYQGDYNEISVAQYRYNNKSALTGNAFNWTTVYKLNHDEYSETEETTFSYPASILPPDPIDVVKPILFNTNLNVTLDYKDVPLFVYNAGNDCDNTQSWINSNNPTYNNTNIDIKPKLNTKLKIKNFEDLKRYYKSVSIFYNFNIETVNGSHNNNGSKFNTTESFRPAKSQSSVLEIDLKNLVFSSSIPAIPSYKNFIQNPTSTQGGGYVYYQGNRSQYNLLSYEFTLEEIDKRFNNSNAIGLDILSNSNDNLNWKINIFITQGKIHGEYERVGLANAYAERYTNKGTANINKIILNPQ